jgi:hypothetical protein
MRAKKIERDTIDGSVWGQVQMLTAFDGRQQRHKQALA